MPSLATARRILLLLGVVLALAACNHIGLVYRNLDRLIPWSVDDYVDMTGAQEQDFKDYLRRHLSWHCSTQLPDYLQWLDRLEQQPVTHANLRARYEEARAALDTVIREITPSTVDLLRRLDDKQVRELMAKLDKEHRERLDKYLDPPLDEQIEERAERMEERVEKWFGRLDDAQRARIRAWSEQLGEHNSQRLANRARWQEAFGQAVQNRQSTDFEQRMTELLQHRERFWAPGYREAFARNEAAAVDLAVDLYAMASERQREHLVRHIADIRKDLNGLDCLREAAR